LAKDVDEALRRKRRVPADRIEEEVVAVAVQIKLGDLLARFRVEDNQSRRTRHQPSSDGWLRSNALKLPPRRDERPLALTVFLLPVYDDNLTSVWETLTKTRGPLCSNRKDSVCRNGASADEFIGRDIDRAEPAAAVADIQRL